MAPLARTPPPPYFAVVFSSIRTKEDPEGYNRTADRMVKLARSIPGFLGLDSVRDATGFGITVSYWESEAAIRAWHQQAEHLDAQRLGRERWYEQFEMRVCRVERAYRFEREDASA